MENAKNQRLWILKDRNVHVQNAERWNLMDMCDNGVWPPKLTLVKFSFGTHVASPL